MSECTDRVSLHILNANRIGELDILLTSLLMQSYQHWDLIMLDESDGPSFSHKHIHDLITRIKCEGHGVIYKHVPAIHNIGKSRNECFEMDDFKNELIIRIDDDSYVEKDYIKGLVETYNHLKSKLIKVGAVGGIVPICGSPNIVKNIPKIFNEIKFDNEGNMTYFGDDGGFSYLQATTEDEKYIPSHHLRSSFLFTREAFLAVNGFPLEYGFNGYREESDFSLKLAFNGYKMYTNPNCVCYHLQAGGGSRQFPPEEYRRLVLLNDEHFKRKVKYWFNKKGGSPFK